MLAIGRALMLDPRLVILDEPSLGLSPKYVDLVLDQIVALKREGRTLLMVEQTPPSRSPSPTVVMRWSWAATDSPIPGKSPRQR